MSTFKDKMRPPKGMEPEHWFTEVYAKHQRHPIRTLIGIYKGNYHKFVLAVICFFIKHACVWILPIVVANIINDITAGNPDTVRNLVGYSLLMAALIVLNVPMNYLYTDYKSQATRYAETGLRKAIICKLQKLSIAYHIETQSGRLQSKVMRDVEAVESLSTQTFLSILNIALNIGVALVVTVSKSMVVFLFFLITTPVAAVTMVGFRNIMKKRNSEFRREMEETSARVMEMVELIPVTRAHALEDEEVRKMNDQLFSVAEKGYKLDLIQALFGSVGWAVFQIFQIVCLAFTGYLAFQGDILVGDITLYQNYFSTIVNQVSAILTLVPIIAKGVESVNSIGEVLLSDDVEQNEGKRPIEKVEGHFEFKNVYFKYHDGEKNTLNGLNLEIKQGETIALVGESGAGKTTILNMIIGFYLTDNGELLLDGQNLNEIDLRTYRKYLAVVPQSSILFSGTIRENITYGCDNVTEEKLLEVVEAANLKDLVDSLPKGLDTMVGEHGGKLSGGQRQRISIARALIRDPKIIVLDEATSALDSISEKLIQEAVNNLTRNRTTFIVAHRLSTIRDADKIAVIAKGKCVEYGTYEELMELKGEFYQLKKIQS
ncbi:MAG: ABC transporter ATP-binding protein/permease [Bacteroidales bacterium]|nr:ABC transporter ATP-binding protein/permease [Lachnoclostridium sp.]MCM1384466.1 ABC transporter ATP-binding protein/permease [Lachnoclostridium sp.]MCM1464011.1 ABC transporter ATP-binding protein/permease [Bacteroidales bacterium]